jgi:hypothetical protein
MEGAGAAIQVCGFTARSSVSSAPAHPAGARIAATGLPAHPETDGVNREHFTILHYKNNSHDIKPSGLHVVYQHFVTNRAGNTAKARR